MAEERKTVDAMLNEQKEQKSAKKNGCNQGVAWTVDDGIVGKGQILVEV